MSALTDKITAALEEAERDAKILGDTWWSTRELETFGMGRNSARHAAAWSPAAVLRHVEHGRKILERHPIGDHLCPVHMRGHRDFDVRPGYGVWVHEPCHELLDLAAAWGVSE